MFKGHFLVAQMRRALHRSEAATPFVSLNLACWGLHLAPVRLELAPVLDVLDDSRGKERDSLAHLGSAQGTVGLWSLITACTDKMTIGAAVHWSTGGHLQADRTRHPLLQAFLEQLLVLEKSLVF